LFFLLLAEKMVGAMSFADAPSSHAECQKRALAPSPSVIFVAALKSCRSVSSQGRVCFHIAKHATANVGEVLLQT
jgi:hypothetical protein